MMENPRTTSARDHDDRDLIEDAEAAPTQGSRSGGRLATDVGTQDELRSEVDDPEAHTRPQKQDDIDNAQASRSSRTGGVTG